MVPLPVVTGSVHVQRRSVHPQVMYHTVTFKAVERNLGHFQTYTHSLPSGPTHQRHGLSVPFPLTSRLAIAAGFLFLATFENSVYERCHVLVLGIKVSWWWVSVAQAADGSLPTQALLTAASEYHPAPGLRAAAISRHSKENIKCTHIVR